MRKQFCEDANAVLDIVLEKAPSDVGDKDILKALESKGINISWVKIHSLMKYVSDRKFCETNIVESAIMPHKGLMIWFNSTTEAFVEYGGFVKEYEDSLPKAAPLNSWDVLFRVLTLISIAAGLILSFLTLQLNQKVQKLESPNSIEESALDSEIKQPNSYINNLDQEEKTVVLVPKAAKSGAEKTDTSGHKTP